MEEEEEGEGGRRDGGVEANNNKKKRRHERGHGVQGVGGRRFPCFVRILLFFVAVPLPLLMIREQLRKWANDSLTS